VKSFSEKFSINTGVAVFLRDFGTEKGVFPCEIYGSGILFISANAQQVPYLWQGPVCVTELKSYKKLRSEFCLF